MLLLDEATSALDSVSEQDISASLKDNRRDKTTITITHRFGAIKDADHIIFLHDYLVVEEGTHDELLGKEGRYKAMIEVQMVSGLVSAQSSGIYTTATSTSSKLTVVETKVKRPSLKSFRRSSQNRGREMDQGPCRESWTTTSSRTSLH